ncbi:MAG: TonB-dependent receptor [Bacteroidales bacterium]|nr:TonB-dependent receptor [Bacteroidales bacterium]
MNGQQTGSTISGIVSDASGNGLVSATISFTKVDDSGRKFFSTTNPSGKFYLKLPEIGDYKVLVSYIGYSSFSKNVLVVQDKMNLGVIPLKELAVNLSEVNALGRATRSIQKGDTMQYNASAFKGIKGGNTEDLIAKMPGIVVYNGNVKAQGEEVKKVLLDGKQFFEGDVTTALRNIPSEIVSSIQVFDKKSEQSEFSGFDDGQSTKTINVVTNRKSHNSYTGKMMVGYGTDNRYQLSGSLNWFNGNRRITLLGMSNNINLQNFSQEDIVGIISSGNRLSVGGSGGMMPPPTGGGITDNLIGQLNGISKINSIGTNYSDLWGKKIEVTAGYFFNSTENNAQTSTNRNYFDSAQQSRNYIDNSLSLSRTYNHRFNMKLDYKIDDRNSLTFMPRISLQNSNYSGNQSADLHDNNSLRKTTASTIGISNGYNLNGLLLYRHKFSKKGRTFSLGLNGGATSTKKNYLFQSTSGNASWFITQLNQQIKNYKSVSNWGVNAMYTEPISKNVQLMANYSLSNQYNKTEKTRLNYNPSTAEYNLLDADLSNIYSNNYQIHRLGSGLHFSTKNANLMAGLNYQYSLLDGNQHYPDNHLTSNSFVSLSPMAMADISLSRYSAMRIGLFSMTSAPTVSQLQPAIDNSNSMMLTTGNPYLKEQISNNLNIRYTHSSLTGQTFIAMFNISNKHNYIGDSVYTRPAQNGLIQQISKPINLDGYWNISSMLTYGFPVDLFQSNFNANVNFEYNRLPGIYNGTKQITQNYTVSPTGILSSNISSNLDFTLSYSAKINLAKSKTSDYSSSSYFNQTGGAKFNWIIYRGITLGSQINWQNYAGLSSGYNENYFLFNASLGKKLFRKDAGEIKIQAYDLLHQNRSINRNVTANYYEDTTNNVLKPYFMISFIYDLRYLKS